MRVAIFAEGRSDQAVLRNILKGTLGTESNDVFLILPENFLDETDLHSPGINHFSNWTLVKSECKTREKITTFFDVEDDNALVIIQIDTAERFEKGYEVLLPVKPKPLTEAYSSELRANTISKMQEWLNNQYIERIEFAVCIEETDAWVLTLFEEKDSAKHNDPKKVLHSLINKNLPDKEKKRHFNKPIFQQYDDLSKDFRKSSVLHKVKLFNKSLTDFCDSLQKRTT